MTALGSASRWSRWALVAGVALLLVVLMATPSAPAAPSAAAAQGGGSASESTASRSRDEAASGDRASRPERAISVYTEYSRLVVPVNDSVRLDLTLDNRGRRDENVHLAVTAVPRGWKASFKGGQFTVSGLPVAAEKSRTLTFTAEPDKGLRPGTYTFQIEGATADRALVVSQPVTIVTEERRAGAAGELSITTAYPVLRGPTDSSFEFSLEVSHRGEGDRVVNVAAEAPRGWEVNVKPAYESKQITSLRIRPGASERVALEVKPPRDAAAGEYPVLFRASADRAQAEARLQVVLTGTYKLDATTPTGRLSVDAVVGKPTAMSLLVRNTGSAVNRNVTLRSFAPENWKVELNPETIEALEPGAFRQVEAKITPAAQALVGDYSVGLTADGEKASKTVELRVTVHAPGTWAWIGVGLMAAAIGGLGGLFAWLGRH